MKTITVEQMKHPHRDADKSLKEYRVIKTTNLTEPKLDTLLTEKEVDLLIVKGVKVDIKR